MLGIVSKNRISGLWLESFQRLAIGGKIKRDMSEGHLDGWGISGYLGGNAVYFGRSEKSAIDDFINYDAACHKAILSNTRILITHLRKATEGVDKIENTHPFIYKEWVFCHNGTIHGSEKLVLPHHKYEGTTDSERFFKFLVSKLEKRSSKYYPEIIKSAVSEIADNYKYTSLTFLLSDGEHLFGCRDFREDGNYYTLYYSYQKNVCLLCSEELPGFDWVKVKNKKLIMIDKYGVQSEF